MTAPNVYVPNAVKFPSGNTLHQVEGIPFDAGFNPLRVIPAGGTFPGFSGYHFVDPTITISTTQIADVLAYLTLDNMAAGSVLTDIDLEYQELGNVNVRTDQTSSDHLSLKANGHLTVLNSISAAAGQAATAEFTIYAISAAAGVAPLIRTAGTSITGSPVIQSLFTLGPVSVDSTDICVDSWRFDLNPVVRKKQCSGGGYMEFASVETSAPTLTVTTDDVAAATAGIDTGTAVTTIEFYLRKKTAGGINVANGTAQHIKFTGTTASQHPGGPREIMWNINTWARSTTSAIT